MAGSLHLGRKRSKVYYRSYYPYTTATTSTLLPSLPVPWPPTTCHFTLHKAESWKIVDVCVLQNVFEDRTTASCLCACPVTHTIRRRLIIRLLLVGNQRQLQPTRDALWFTSSSFYILCGLTEYEVCPLISAALEYNKIWASMGINAVRLRPRFKC